MKGFITVIISVIALSISGVSAYFNHAPDENVSVRFGADAGINPYIEDSTSGLSFSSSTDVVESRISNELTVGAVFTNSGKRPLYVNGLVVRLYDSSVLTVKEGLLSHVPFSSSARANLQSISPDTYMQFCNRSDGFLATSHFVAEYGIDAGEDLESGNLGPSRNAIEMVIHPGSFRRFQLPLVLYEASGPDIFEKMENPRFLACYEVSYLTIQGELGKKTFPAWLRGMPMIASDDKNYQLHTNFLLPFLANRKRTDLNVQRPQIPMIAPVRGEYEVISLYGVRRDPVSGRVTGHDGLDFTAPEEASVIAAADGRVVFADPRSAYGRVVEIEHSNGVTTRYAHLSALSVSAGDKVRAGDKVGVIGTSGRTTFRHVHFEVIVNGRRDDPLMYLQFPQNDA